MIIKTQLQNHQTSPWKQQCSEPPWTLHKTPKNLETFHRHTPSKCLQSPHKHTSSGTHPPPSTPPSPWIPFASSLAPNRSVSGWFQREEKWNIHTSTCWRCLCGWYEIAYLNLDYLYLIINFNDNQEVLNWFWLVIAINN